MKQLTLDTILQLRNLVLEKDARLAAISNRFDVLAGLVSGVLLYLLLWHGYGKWLAKYEK